MKKVESRLTLREKRKLKKTKDADSTSAQDYDKCTVQLKLGKDVRCLGLVEPRHFWEGSRDGAVHIRKLAKGEEVAVVKPHSLVSRESDETFFVNSIARQHDKVWVCDSLGNVRAYSLDGADTIVYQKQGAQSGVKTFACGETYHGEWVFYGNQSFTVTQLSSATAMHDKVMVGHTSWVNCLCIDNVNLHIWSGSEDGICVWTTAHATNENFMGDQEYSKTKKIETSADNIARLKKHKGEVKALCAVDHMVWSGGEDGTIVIWRAADRKPIQKLNVGSYPVTCIKVVGNEVYSTSSAGASEVIVWERNDSGTQKRKITLPGKMKVVDMIYMEGTVWFGCRAPGYLLKYACTTSPAGSSCDNMVIEDEHVEERGFLRFINWQLAMSEKPEHKNMRASRLFRDFSTIILPLIETLAGKDANFFAQSIPSTAETKLACAETAITWLLQQLTNGPELTGKFNIAAMAAGEAEAEPDILELLWEIIRKWHIKLGYKSGKTEEALLRWVNSTIENVPDVRLAANFGWSWYDGHCLAAMVEAHATENNSLTELPQDLNDAIAMVMKRCEKLDVPNLISNDDLRLRPSPRVLMTLVACFRASGAVANPTLSKVEGPFFDRDQPTKRVRFEVTALLDDKSPAVNADCEIQLTGPNGIEQMNIHNNRDGTFTVTRDGPLALGKYCFKALLDGGEEVQHSPIYFNVEAANPNTSYAEGPTDAVSEDAKHRTIKVFALNSEDEPVYGSNCQVWLSSKGGKDAELVVTDNGDGTFTAVLSEPLGVGTHRIEVDVDGSGVRNSPIIITITGASGDKSYAEGPGLNAAGASSDNQADRTFTVFALDNNEQPALRATCKISLSDLSDSEAVTAVTAVNNGDGTFSACFEQPLPPGEYMLDVYVDGTPVRNSSVDIVITEGVDQNQSFVEGPGLDPLGASSANPADRAFTVHALDKNGKPVLGSTCEAGLERPDGSREPVTAIDCGDGFFSAAFDEPLPPGRYMLHVALDGTPVSNSPFEIVVKPKADGNKSYAQGPGLKAAGASSPNNADRVFTVYTLDKDGKPVLGSKCEVCVLGPNGSFALTPEDTGNGTYGVCFSEPLGPGEYMVDVVVDGNPVSNSPIDIVIKPGLGKSYAAGPGLEGGAASSDPSQRTFEVYCLDANNKASKNSKVEATLIHPNGDRTPIGVKNNGDGTWSAVFGEPLAPGIYTVEIDIDGNKLTYKLDVKSPYAIDAQGPGLVDGVKMGTSHTSFDMRVFDTTSNKPFIHDGGSAGTGVEVRVTDSKGKECDVTTTSNKGGQYHVHYKATSTGRHVIEVLVNGYPVQNMPLTVHVSQGASASRSTNIVFSFTVTANPGAFDSKAIWDVSALKENSKEHVSVKCTTTDQSYTACFEIDLASPPHMLKLDALLNGHAIPASPQYLNFTR